MTAIETAYLNSLIFQDCPVEEEDFINQAYHRFLYVLNTEHISAQDLILELGDEL